MSAQVLGESGFCCTREAACRASALRRQGTSFWRGQLSHVGHHYDVVEDGLPWRVLLLGMETGRDRELVTLAERRLEQQPVIAGDPRSRKPHMKGTASALRLAFGRTPGPDRHGELLDLANTPQPVHVMDAYALVNVRLCSAVATGTTASRGTAVMTANCLPHLAATVRILEPTLCILQSRPSRVGIDPLVTRARTLVPNLEHVHLAGVPVYLASFGHPHQMGPHSSLNWGRSFSTPYLDDVVAPAIRAARDLRGNH
ncbi:hypothetical protein [Saccharothrix hoggarensis]|uniref:Uracil DNA glycosylase superfamily protein n=1 Tax=Saccharothrix hoggarensis TaxID=913853 RepID=A0ABW3QTA4_9PSEU